VKNPQGLLAKDIIPHRFDSYRFKKTAGKSVEGEEPVMKDYNEIREKRKKQLTRQYTDEFIDGNSPYNSG
jgi:hypothetical protein